jgi:hypothetical protein
MAGGLFARLKTWRTKENVRSTDLNNEFNNIINNLKPDQLDDYSATVSQMQSETNPGAVGTESQATSLAGELERLRYVIRRAFGIDNWYENPETSLASLKASIEAGIIIATNRVESGRVDSNDQPMYLVPGGGSTVELLGSVTPFRCYIQNTLVEVSTDLTLSGLAGPGAFTTLVNDTGLSGQASSKLQGENGTSISIDTPTGTPPTVNTFQAWKVGATEYFFGRYESSSGLNRCSRGFFFDASDVEIPRLAISNNDTITLCRAAYIFFTNVASTPALAVTYNKPSVAYDQPAGASSGDWWFDLAAGFWKKFDGSSWADGTGLFIGIAVVDGSTVVGCRSFDFGRGFSAVNTASIQKYDNATIRSIEPGAQINVYGSNFSWIRDNIVWDMSADLDSGLTEASSTVYYFYITNEGDTIISDVAPYDRRTDLFGFYHPHKPWRAIGYATNDGSSNLGTAVTYDLIKTDEIQDGAITPAKKAALGQGISSSTASFTTTSTSYVDVTNATATVVVTGRPVRIELMPGSSSSAGYIGVEASSQAIVAAEFKLIRGSTDIGIVSLERAETAALTVSGTRVPPGCLSMIDTGAAEGTHIYKLQAKAQAGTTVSVTNCKLVVYEL